MEPITRGRVRIERTAKRIRAFLGGRAIADTTRALLVWEVPYYPVYYFPREDVAAELKPNGRTTHVPSRGDSVLYDVEGVADAALAYPDSPIEELRDTSGSTGRRWTPGSRRTRRSTSTRATPTPGWTSCLSSRHVRVEVDGVTVADSDSPRILFETGLPPRYYLPKTDVRLDLLDPTDTGPSCPYKGEADYWSVRAANGCTPTWPGPTAPRWRRASKIAGLICFYNEKVDIYVERRDAGAPQVEVRLSAPEPRSPASGRTA